MRKEENRDSNLIKKKPNDEIAPQRKRRLNNGLSTQNSSQLKKKTTDEGGSSSRLGCDKRKRGTVGPSHSRKKKKNPDGKQNAKTANSPKNGEKKFSEKKRKAQQEKPTRYSKS